MDDGWRVVVDGLPCAVSAKVTPTPTGMLASAHADGWRWTQTNSGWGETEAQAIANSVYQMARVLVDLGHAVTEVVPPGAMTRADAVAAERAACVKVCDDVVRQALEGWPGSDGLNAAAGAGACRDAIRSRGGV